MLKPGIDRSTHTVDYYVVKKAILVFRALNNKLRQKIIDTLDENTTLTVSELYTKLRLDQSITSQHLSVLRKAGVVTTKREGKKIFYSLNKERIEVIEKLAKDLVA